MARWSPVALTYALKVMAVACATAFTAEEFVTRLNILLFR